MLQCSEICNNKINFLCSGYTDLAMSTISQKMSVTFSGSPSLLIYYLNQLAGDIEYLMSTPSTMLRVFKSVVVSLSLSKIVLRLSFTI